MTFCNVDKLLANDSNLILPKILPAEVKLGKYRC